MEQTLEQRILALERENSDLHTSLNASEMSRREAENALTKEKSLRKRAGTCRTKAYRKNPALMHMIEVAEHTLSNPKKILQNTECTREQFAALLMPFADHSNRSPRAPLFRSGRTPHAPGNRCKLYPRHALFMALIRLRMGTQQVLLTQMFGIDQSTVSD